MAPGLRSALCRCRLRRPHGMAAPQTPSRERRHWREQARRPRRSAFWRSTTRRPHRPAAGSGAGGPHTRYPATLGANAILPPYGWLPSAISRGLFEREIEDPCGICDRCAPPSPPSRGDIERWIGTGIASSELQRLVPAAHRDSVRELLEYWRAEGRLTWHEGILRLSQK